MTKVALYARDSSDNQSVASIEDQLRICREHAARERWKVVATYHDAAISGASVILRPGVQALLQDAQRGKFEIVLAEALDRVSRDQADVATLFKHLRFAGVRIVTLAAGDISELHVGLKGTMNGLFLKDLAAKTHRGLRRRVEKGKAGGGLCYGYRVVKKIDAGGEPIRGEREIAAEEASVVRRVFREFAAGKSPIAIATDLNRQGILGPLGKRWADTTIRGHVSRGNAHQAVRADDHRRPRRASEAYVPCPSSCLSSLGSAHLRRLQWPVRHRVRGPLRLPQSLPTRHLHQQPHRRPEPD